MPLQGDLGSIPLADVIQLVAGARRSGMLYVAAPDDARVFAFREGDIVSATSLEQRFRLGHALCRRGLLDPGGLERALEVQRATKGKALGDILLERGAVTAESLRETLRDQVQSALDDVLHWQDGGFLFADALGGEAPAAPSGITFVVGPMLFEALRRLDEWSRHAQTFADPAQIVEFHEGSGEGSLPPGSSDALELLEQVDGRRSIGILRRKLPWAEHRIVRALAILLEARMIRLRPHGDSSKFAPSLWQDHARHLAVAPRAAGRAIALATAEKTSAVDLHAAGLSDPGLAVAVLRAAGNIGRNEGAQFSTLRDAVVALGDEVLRRVLVAAGLRGLYSKANRGYDVETWRHSLCAAAAAARIAPRLGLPKERAAEAYLGGLLHDVGILLLRSTCGEDYDRVDEAVAQGKQRADAERKILGIGHEKVGARALEHWCCSPTLIDVTRDHHAGPRGEPWLLAVVQAADAVAAHAGYDAEALPEGQEPLERTLAALLGLDARTSQKILAEVTEEAGSRDPLW